MIDYTKILEFATNNYVRGLMDGERYEVRMEPLRVARLGQEDYITRHAVVSIVKDNDWKK